MDKKQWKTVAISAATLLLLFLLVIWVFRDHYQEILRNIQAVSIRELLLLLGMGLAYQMLESAVCFAMIRRRLPTFSYRQAVEVTFLGVFGNVSTLSVGSVPMQSYYLHHCGMMTGCGIGTMMLEYMKVLRKDILERVVFPVIDAKLLDENTKYYINPTGRFVLGGPAADTGLTGRKIICDTYGGIGHHGGGAFSGKDATKVDRSAAYMARHVAKTAVAAGAAKQLELQLGYAIGVSEPVSVSVETFGTGRLPDDVLCDWVRNCFDLRPGAIIQYLKLDSPIFAETTNYGHFGRNGFPWEQVNETAMDALKMRLV